METDIVKKIEDAEKGFSTYYDKLDADFKLWDLEETIYEKYETGINVTTNEPRLFANDVQTDLAAAEMQISVKCLEEEKEDEREKAGRLERLFNFLFSQADERLISLVLPPLKETLIWLFLIRGAAGTRILNYKDGDKLVPDYMAVDPRWFTYNVGGKGLSWVANKIFKTKAALEDDYGYKVKEAPWYLPWVKDKELYTVHDYWELAGGKVSNGILCEKNILEEKPYKNLTKLPFLFMPVTSRPPVVTPGNSEKGRYGDSIYASGRGMYPLESRLASIGFTHANILAKQPLLNYVESDDPKLRLDSTVLYAEGVLNLNKNKQKVEASPLKEISPTLVNFMGWITGKIERGQTPHIKTDSPHPSGTMGNIYREMGNRIYNPQIRVLSQFYAGMCRMIEEQLLSGGIEGDNKKRKIEKVRVETEREGEYLTYDISPVDLKKPHTIKVEITVKTPWSQMDVAQLGDMLIRQGFPERWVREFIYKVPDPKLLEDLAILELAEHSPKLMLKKAIEVLMKYGRVDDAELLVEEADRVEAQERMVAGEVPPEGTPTERVPTTPPIEVRPPEIPPEGMGL